LAVEICGRATPKQAAENESDLREAEREAPVKRDDFLQLL